MSNTAKIIILVIVVVLAVIGIARFIKFPSGNLTNTGTSSVSSTPSVSVNSTPAPTPSPSTFQVTQTSSQTAAVPAEFSDLYPVLLTDLQNYNTTLNGEWHGSKSQVLLGAEFIPGDDYASIFAAAKAGTLDIYYDQQVTPYLNAFQGMGMTTVKFLIQFPMLYQPFYKYEGDTSGVAYANTVAFYQKLINDMHSRGMKVIIQSEAQPAGNGAVTGDPLDLAAYYATFPNFDTYVNARAENTLAIAQQLKPDFLNFSSEPDTEGPKTGNSVAAAALSPTPANTNFASNVQYLQTTILNTLVNANLPGLHSSLKLAVGMGSWEYDMPTILQNELALKNIDIIDIHVHPINDLSSGKNLLANVLMIANAANAAGKQTGMDEDWEFKERNSEIGPGGYGAQKVSDATIDSRDHWSFWAPVDQAFLQDMVDTAYYEHMTYFSAAEPAQFFAYLNYSDTPGCETSSTAANPPSSVCSSTQWDEADNKAVAQALSTNPVTLTDTGSFYAGLIKGE